MPGKVENVKIEDRFERILKDLDRCAQQVNRGSRLLDNLDAKVDARRLQTVLERCRSQLRVEVFAFQDAVSLLPRKEADRVG